MILPSVSKYLLELVAGPNLLCLRISVFPTATTAALSVVAPPKFALCASVEKAVRPTVCPFPSLEKSCFVFRTRGDCVKEEETY